MFDRYNILFSLVISNVGSNYKDNLVKYWMISFSILRKRCKYTHLKIIG